jgi:ABC-type lipoprotein release transport system permease subunit
VELGKDRVPAVVVGIPASSLPPGTRCVEGRLYRDGHPNELVVGTGLARRLHLRPGSRIPPFYRNDRGERLSQVVGVFRSDVSLWQSRLILTSLETAAAIFAQEGMANEVLVYCRPGTAGQVQKAIGAMVATGAPAGLTRCHIISRTDLEALVPAGLSHRSGLFQLHFLIAIAATTLVLTVTSGIGLPDRAREIGVLKATGWQTDEVLLRGVVESSLIGVGAAALALILSFVWLRVGNGVGIAGLFLSGVSASPSFEVPFQLSPLAALLSFAFGWIVVTAGTLTASWRAAIVSPRAAMG